MWAEKEAKSYQNKMLNQAKKLMEKLEIFHSLSGKYSQFEKINS